jgi:hypothetical protein
MKPNFLMRILNAIMESRQKAAAREVARMLKHNPDFRAFSECELYERILDKENPVYLDGSPVHKAA